MFRQGDEGDRNDDQSRLPGKGRGVKGGQSKPSRLLHRREIHQSGRGRHPVSSDDADQHRDQVPKSPEKDAGDDGDGQGGQGDGEMLQGVHLQGDRPRLRIHVFHGAGQGVKPFHGFRQFPGHLLRTGHIDGHPGQSETDHDHHRSDHHRRQQMVEPAHTEPVDQEGDQAVDQSGQEAAEQGRTGSLRLGHGNDRDDESEGGTQVGGDLPPGYDQIRQGADPAGKERHRRVEPGQDRNQNRRAKHRKKVLHAEHQPLKRSRPLVDIHHDGLVHTNRLLS